MCKLFIGGRWVWKRPEPRLQLCSGRWHNTLVIAFGLILFCRVFWSHARIRAVNKHSTLAKGPKQKSIMSCSLRIYAEQQVNSLHCEVRADERWFCCCCVGAWTSFHVKMGQRQWQNRDISMTEDEDFNLMLPEFIHESANAFCFAGLRE